MALGNFSPLPSGVVVFVALAATTSLSLSQDAPEVLIVMSFAAHSMQHGMAVGANSYQVFHRGFHSSLELRQRDEMVRFSDRVPQWAIVLSERHVAHPASVLVT